MKTHFLPGCVAALTLITLLFSCKKDDDLAVNMSATVGGKTWEAEAAAQSLQGLFNISGKASDGSVLTITLDGFEEKQYPSNFGTTNAIVYLPANASAAFVSHTEGAFGIVEITKIDETAKTVTGTFNAYMQNPASGDTVTVWNGRFDNVPYTLETVQVGDNFLKAKIDGVSWEALSVNGVLSGNDVMVVGTDAAASKTIGLTIPKSANPGTYPIGSIFDQADVTGQYNVDSSTFLGSDSGELVISQHDKLNRILAGTFKFEASTLFGSDEASITGGSFYVKY